MTHHGLTMDDLNPLTPTSHRSWKVSLLAPLAVFALCGLATVFLLDGVRERGDLSSYDQPVHVWFVDHRTPVWTAVMTGVSLIGGEVVTSVLAAVVVLLLAWRHRRREAVVFGVALAIAEGTSVLVKHLVARGRPPAPAVIGPLEQTMSFPSGHTIGTTTLVLVLSYLWWSAGPSWARAIAGAACSALAAVIMAVSRLYLGYHWLTDVLAAMTMGCGVVALVVLGDHWWSRRGPTQQQSVPAA